MGRRRIPGSRPRGRRFASAVLAGVPYFGVCFGAQLLASAFGAQQLPWDGGRAAESTRSSSPRRPVETRCSAASRPTSTCASGIPTTSHCRWARSVLPGRLAMRTRPSGSAGSRTASSATSRRRARTSRLGSNCSPRPSACSSRGTAPDRCRPSSTTSARSCRACVRPRGSCSDVGWRTRWRSATWRARYAPCGRWSREGPSRRAH